MVKLKKGITIKHRYFHSKAVESYVSVEFEYGDTLWEGWVPVQYRRTGLDLEADSPAEIEYINGVYERLNPNNQISWLEEQQEFWDDEHKRSLVTKEFFDKLADGRWHCRKCLVPNNSNPARRIQDLKEYGYTISTDTKRYCDVCDKKTTHHMLLWLPRLDNGGNGYETFTPAIRKRIIKVLGGVEVYENKPSRQALPDHKFSEARWDDQTKSVNPDTMTDDEIRAKFQLLTNQHNLQKREVCRICKQTGLRQRIFDIEFFYAGTIEWDHSIPMTGKAAEAGCVGCAWYDIQKWRQELQKVINQASEKDITD